MSLSCNKTVRGGSQSVSYNVRDSAGTNVGVARHWSVQSLLLLTVSSVGHSLRLAPHSLQALLSGEAGDVQQEVHSGHSGATIALLGTVTTPGVAGVAVSKVRLRDLDVSTHGLDTLLLAVLDALPGKSEHPVILTPPVQLDVVHGVPDRDDVLPVLDSLRHYPLHQKGLFFRLQLVKT